MTSYNIPYGNQDILWRNTQTGQVNVWLTNPSAIGVLSKGTLGTVADLNWEIIGLGNFNSNTDSKSDLLWRNKQTGQVNVWLINGTAVLSKGTLGTVSDLNWEIIKTGDFNSDGNTDLLWRNSQTGQVNVWLTNPSAIGVSSKGTLGTISDMNWKIIGLGNFNSNTDSKSDLLWRNSQTGQVNVWLINGTAVSSKGTLGTVSDFNWEIIKTDDFNSDSNTDLLWKNSQTGQVNVWLTNPASISVSGKGTLGTVADLSWEIIGVGNFNINTDSKSDLLWRNNQTGQVNVWLINATAVLSKGTLGTVSDLNWEIITSGNFNTDSNTDLLWRNSQTGQVNVWLTNPSSIGVLSKGTLGTVSDMNWEILPPSSNGIYHICNYFPLDVNNHWEFTTGDYFIVNQNRTCASGYSGILLGTNTYEFSSYVQNQENGFLFTGCQYDEGQLEDMGIAIKFMSPQMQIGETVSTTIPPGIISTNGSTIDTTLIGTETVTVPAGTFDALKFEILINDIGECSYKTSLWLAKGIGPVKIHRTEPNPADCSGCVFVCVPDNDVVKLNTPAELVSAVIKGIIY